MRSKLLKMLLDRQTEFISGEAISNHLGCSRTAVWKHIEELRKAGYKLEAVPRKGYRLLHQPNLLTEHEIKAGLETNFLAKNVVYEKSVTSTQEIALRLANNGAVNGTIVVADEQLKGRGRLGRQWFSPIGTGIWLSLIIKPKIPPQQAPQLTLLTAVAVVLAIKAATGLQCEIKWPNDVLLNGKKLVGILTEMQADPDQIRSIIIGIGVNVNQDSFSEELEEIATSLKLVAGKEQNRADILQKILLYFERLYEEYISSGFLTIKKQWEENSLQMKRKIIAKTSNGAISGYMKGITDEGVLLLEDDSGTIHKIYSADIDFNVTNL